MDLSVILVTHNSEKFILPCLDSIIKATHGTHNEILIIDNHSTDLTKELCKQYRYPVTLIENHENRGFAKAANIGLRKSCGEFRLLMNPDVILQSEALGRILDFMRSHPNAGICGCRLLNEDGSLQHSKGSFPTLFSTIYRVILPRRVRKYHLWGYGKAGRCDWVTGAFMLLRSSMIRAVGLLDENYFMYYEDVDLCLQARKAGWQTYYYPEVAGFHLTPHAVSDKGIEIETQIRKSRRHYFRKNVFVPSYRKTRI